MSINQAVLAGENLLNGLVEVLIRFRLGRYACVADISKCFFQVGFLVTSRIGLELFGMKIMIWIAGSHRCFVLPGMSGGSIQAPMWHCLLLIV